MTLTTFMGNLRTILLIFGRHLISERLAISSPALRTLLIPWSRDPV